MSRKRKPGPEIIDDRGWKLVRVTGPNFVAGMIVSKRDGYVMRSAPILGRIEHWTLEDALEYCQERGWSLEWIK